jgi:hypothetical protein
LALRNLLFVPSQRVIRYLSLRVIPNRLQTLPFDVRNFRRVKETAILK